MQTYLALPDGTDKCPAVLVLQEVFGVNREIKRICDLVAKSGYIGFAPELFHRTHPGLALDYTDAARAKGREGADATTMESIAADLNASIDFLMKHSRCDGSIAAWGFCYGGSLAYMIAGYPSIKASVSFYGGQIGKPQVPHRPPMIEFTAQLKAPIFLAFGEKDPSIPMDEVAAIKKALDEHGKRYQLEIYPNEGHGFFRFGINGESTPGARDVWPKVQKFLAENVGAPVAV